MGEDPDWEDQDTMALISLDNLAHRYNLLPSEALNRATTFDLKVLDVSARWQRHQQDVADGKVVAKKRTTLTQEEMQAMINRVRERHG